MIDSKELPQHLRTDPDVMAARLDTHRTVILGLQSSLDTIKSDVTEVKQYVIRGGLLIGLWGTSLLLLLGSDEKAKAIADILKTILGKS
jgi:hypothetical protein